MRLTSVLALVCFHQTVLSAPTVTHKELADDQKTTKQGPSDTLELELQGFNHHPPIIYQHESEPQNEPIRHEAEFVAANNGGPEVKRSERVDTEDAQQEVIDRAGDLSDNMKLADQEVKTVLKTFFQNLKHHPEIVEEILEREGAKLMQQHTLEEGGEREDHAQTEAGHEENPVPQEEGETEAQEPEQRPQVEDNTGDGPLDMSDFQRPSPQLLKSPKQVEKKAGAFPQYPRYIYKSPMRDTKERDELTARSLNNPALETSKPSNHMIPQTIIVNDGNDETSHSDLSNTIPVIQQPVSDNDAEEKEAEDLLTNPEEGGEIDLAALQRAQEEYSREHPFVNTLPLFPAQPSDAVNVQRDVKVDQVAEDEDVEKHLPGNAEVQKSGETENTEADDTAAEAQSDDKRSEPESHEGGDEPENRNVEGNEDTDGRWSETQVVEKPLNPEDEVHLNNPAGGKDSVAYRPNAYYYYYNDDELKDDGAQLDAAEEGAEEDDDEDQLHKITIEADNSEDETEEADDSKEEEKLADDNKDDEEMNGDEEENDEQEVEDEEEEDDDDDEEEDEHDETDEQDNVEQDTDSSSEDNVRNSKTVNVKETVIVPADPAKSAAPRLFTNDGPMDKNEADLLSLFANGQQKTVNRPIAGPPM